MKRTIFSIVAVVMGVFAVAFTTPKTNSNKFIDSYFEFNDALYLPTVGNVQDESKWVKVSDMGSCDDIPVSACRLRVAPTYVSGTNLLSTANIHASESSPDIAYVDAGNYIAKANKH